MATILYLDCSSGVSGDMLAGALLGLGGAEAEQRARQHLRVAGIDPGLVRTEEVRRGGFVARELTVADRPGFATFDELIAAVRAAERLPEAVRDGVIAVAERMAAAERAVHGLGGRESAEGSDEGDGDDEGGGDEGSVSGRPGSGEVKGSGEGGRGAETGGGEHLHELAGLDTAVDLIAVTSLVDTLQVERIVASPPALGGGSVQTAHGRLSVPAPAVLALLRGLPTAGGSTDEGELTTPTGAALLAQLADEFGPLPAGQIEAVACGAGQRELADRPNVLRALLIRGPAFQTSDEAAGAPAGGEDGAHDEVELLETNIDDCTPEVLAQAAERLRAEGALDAWLTPAVMKKGRSGVVLHALARAADTTRLAGVVFAETTTFGLRVTPVRRLCLQERWAAVEVFGARVRARLGYLDGRLVTASPEHGDCVAAAEGGGVSLRRAYETACAVLHKQFFV